MQKFAIAVLIAATTPMLASASDNTDLSVITHPARFSTSTLTDAPKKDVLLAISGVNAASSDAEPQIVGTVNKTDEALLAEAFDMDMPKLTLDQLVKAIEDGDTTQIERHIDYDKIHTAYLSQMNYINAKVKSLSDRVSQTAAGTFETRVREGSMMLGLLSEQIDLIVKDAAKDRDNFKTFIANKFNEFTRYEMAFNYEYSDGLYLIEAKFPNTTSKDLIVATQTPTGSYKLVAYIPKEIEDINDITNRLLQSASAAQTLGDELERMAITRSAIGADELPEQAGQKKQTKQASVEDAIDQAQSIMADAEK
ncbi:DUF2939 domain-containing protein [Photobacterium galatheae]|uniref:Uncharacterized protein n=1 Tax=Photobacterium galatheae TaxID=1654360 RepID=A0A066RKF6_9GAMM|nr:hypothetical protein [Photobacterium galatheae]KDM90935.1 hypothetical protein EA58_14360 [Photobacterium galatheae]MCM0149101.1 hypothetical protein [Photobacterium galatheae]